jgi:hypothetical protein
MKKLIFIILIFFFPIISFANPWTTGFFGRIGFGHSFHWIRNIPDGMRTIPEYGYEIRKGYLPSKIQGRTFFGTLGFGYTFGQKVDLNCDFEYIQSYSGGRSTWNEVSFPGADDYVGYRYNGFIVTPLVYFYPFRDEVEESNLYLVGGVAINLNTKFSSGQDAWNSFHPIYEIRAGNSLILGAGVNLIGIIDLQLQFRNSINGPLTHSQICINLRFNIIYPGLLQ